MVHIGNDWDERLAEVFGGEQYAQLRAFLKAEYSAHRVYPDMHDIFNALRATPFADTRVVILGQDPYHGPGQAHGLCFSVKPGVANPPSLENIFKEIQEECGKEPPENGDLTRWAQQGVLLLNNTLTVRAGQAASHAGHGWEAVTDAIVRQLNDHPQPLVFLLWGSHAQAKAKSITNPKHLLLKAPHPSPLSAYRGFFGCGHFVKANEFLQANGRGEINW